MRSMKTTWYVTYTPAPAILGLPSCSQFGIVHCNCSIEFHNCGTSSPKHAFERGKVQHNLAKLKPSNTPPAPINLQDEPIKASPDRFKGISRFPDTYHITLWNDARSVVHAPQKCPIAKSARVTEPTDWVSSLAYSWKANRKLWVCLDSKDLNMAIWQDHYRTLTVEEITHELVGSTRSPNWMELLHTYASYLTTNHHSSLPSTHCGDDSTLFASPWVLPGHKIHHSSI